MDGSPLASHNRAGITVNVTVKVYMLSVTEVLPDWKESSRRNRAWLSAADASKLIDEPQLAALVLTLTEGMSYRLPITQRQLADALGVSPVHVNRVLQNLRAEKVISWVSTSITILDWDRLVEIAEFDPAYLSLRSEAR